MEGVVRFEQNDLTSVIVGIRCLYDLTGYRRREAVSVDCRSEVNVVKDKRTQQVGERVSE